MNDNDPRLSKRRKTSVVHFIGADAWINMACRIDKNVNILQSEEHYRRFRAIFGTTPMVLSLLWRFIADYSNIPSGWEPMHILWGCLFLKIYVSEHVHSKNFGGVDRKTFRKR